ncbi:MAG: sigma-54 dependent transcriptional regulator [Candidatus Poribacteria bacterium]|nr:sigma-54 dependent transcriptional regulator [Candidatus Poribacteria bacterium]
MHHRTKGDKSQQHVDGLRPTTKIRMSEFAPSRLLPEGTLHGNYESIVGRSPQMLKVLNQVDKIANTIARVLICGETGTGKELIARALHQNSDRARNKMISLNCAAIPDMLLESELFGHEKGAFTDAKTQHIGKFQRAHNGTLFLDEIGDMPLALQAKLLRVIETNEIERLGGTEPIPVNVRVVAATHCDLVRSVENGTFREDLYYRLKAISVALPPLRDRREDIRVLVEYFVKQHCKTYNRPGRKMAPETLARLQTYPWPGNVRELENTLISVVLLNDEEVILPRHLPEEILAFGQPGANVPQEMLTSENQKGTHIPLGTSLKVAEETLIHDTLAWQNGNRTKTARILGISVRTLQNRLKGY